MLRALPILLATLLLGAAAPSDPSKTLEETAMPTFTKITPVLLAENVEACVEFWQQLGLEVTMTVPFEDGVGFAAVAADDVELMYQSFAMSAAQDPKAIHGVRQTIVYLEVQSLAEIEAKLGDAEIVVPARYTGHGTRELYVRDPAGNLIGFAETSS